MLQIKYLVVAFHSPAVMNASQLFATLVVFQAAHSLEETIFDLYDLLPYIRWMDDVAPGGAFIFFVVANTMFVSFGGWCYVARVRPGHPNAGVFITLWVVIEILNGILHPGWSLNQRHVHSWNGDGTFPSGDSSAATVAMDPESVCRFFVAVSRARRCRAWCLSPTTTPPCRRRRSWR